MDCPPDFYEKSKGTKLASGKNTIFYNKISKCSHSKTNQVKPGFTYYQLRDLENKFDKKFKNSINFQTNNPENLENPNMLKI